MFVKWDITSKCNLNCMHCCVGGGKNDTNELDTNDIIEIIKSLKINTDKLDYIHFLGGEPFAKDNIKSIFSCCLDNNIGIGITTNGTYEIDCILEYLDKNKSMPIVMIFSLDGPNEYSNDKIRGKNVFQKCVRNLKKISEYKKLCPNLHVGISATINKINIEFIEEYLQLSNECNVDVIGFYFIDNKGNAKLNYNELALTNYEKVNAIHRLAKKYLNYTMLNIQLPISIKSVNYLNNLYGCNINYNTNYNNNNNCMALTDSIRMDNVGNICACESIDNLTKSNTDITGSLLDFRYENISQNSTIKKQQKYIASLINKNNYPATRLNCEYYYCCSTCPLNTTSELIEQCEFCDQVCNSQQ